MECAWYTDNKMGYDKLHKASHEPLRKRIWQTYKYDCTTHRRQEENRIQKLIIFQVTKTMLIVETKLRKYGSDQITLFDVFILNSNVVILVGDTYNF